MPAGTRALVVGAGAIGQVYGHHLRRGGAEVSFLVKPAHAAEARGGFTLYALNRARRQRARPEAVAGFDVIEDPAAVAGRGFDQIYLAVSSTALRAGDWFARLARGLGNATLVLLQPGPDDRAFVAAHVPEAQIVAGVITVVSYRAPLPGETRFSAPGVAYWFPPLGASPMAGPPTRLGPVLAALRAGGLPARRGEAALAASPFATALLMPLLAVLEAEGWSWARFARRAPLARATGAAAEALAAVAASLGRRPPLALRLVARPLGVRLLLRAARLVMPMDVEAYLAAHFTKVGDQTRDFLRGYLAKARAAGQSAGTLAALTASS